MVDSETTPTTGKGPVGRAAINGEGDEAACHTIALVAISEDGVVDELYEHETISPGHTIGGELEIGEDGPLLGLALLVLKEELGDLNLLSLSYLGWASGLLQRKPAHLNHIGVLRA